MSFINPATGQLAIDVVSATPLTTQQAGSLVTIDFHVLPGAVVGVTPIQLVESVNPNGGHVFATEVSDGLGAYTLTPAPGRVGTSGGIAGSISILGESLANSSFGDAVSVRWPLQQEGGAPEA